MKYLIETTEFAECPSDWTNRRSWPHEGVFTVKTEPDYVYIVERNSVKLVYDGKLLTSRPFGAIEGAYGFTSEPPSRERAEAEAAVASVSESLFLRAIAAASRGKVVE